MAENRPPEQVAGELRQRAAAAARVENMVSALEVERQGYVQRADAARVAGNKELAAAMAQRVKDVDTSIAHWESQHPDAEQPAASGDNV